MPHWEGALWGTFGQSHGTNADCRLNNLKDSIYQKQISEQIVKY